MKKRIIDRRKKEKFMIDDEYLNGMAKLVGIKGTAVYMSLCRHANKDQQCFPSIKKMAEQHGISRDSIMRGVKDLKKRNVISVKKTKLKNGKWLNNTYILLEKSEWNYNQVANIDMEKPGRKIGKNQVANIDTKETHIKETHNMQTKVCEENFDLKNYINELRRDKRNHIKLIGWYFQHRESFFPDRKTANAEVKRWIKDANFITSYPPEMAEKTLQFVKNKFPDEWNLSTIRKYIPEIKNN